MDIKNKYDNFWSLFFESENKNGEKNGKGKEYNNNDSNNLEGEFKNGKRLKGKEYANNKLVFEGEYYNEFCKIKINKLQKILNYYLNYFNKLN